MANTLTNDGEAHIVELDATGPGTTTEDFDLLILSRGNDATDVTDDRSAVLPADEIDASRTLVSDGYPVLGDTDTRNPGADPDWWTWKFEVAAGVTGLVASNLMVTNWNGGAPALNELVLVHALLASPISKLTPERMTVWLNVVEAATAGPGPTIYSAVDTPTVAGSAARAQTWTARARALHTAPQGVRVNPSRISTRVKRGESVWTSALLDGPDGYPLRREEVSRVTLHQSAVRPHGERWSLIQPLDPLSVVATSTVTGDPRAASSSYNFAHQWVPPFTRSNETAWDLTYVLRLHDRTKRRIEVEVLVG